MAHCNKHQCTIKSTFSYIWFQLILFLALLPLDMNSAVAHAISSSTRWVASTSTAVLVREVSLSVRF